MIVYPIQAGTTVTRVFESGDAGAPKLLLLHGLSSRADRWIRNIDALAEAGYHVFAPDLPGHGFAQKSTDFDHTIGGYADFTLSFLDAIGADRAHCVGTSLGGQIVAKAVLKQPERAMSLMVIGSTGFARTTRERALGFRNWIMNLTPESHRPKLQNVFTDSSLATDDMVREDVMINTSPGASACFDKFLDYMEERINDDLVLDGLKALDGKFPLLLFWGIDDTSVSVEIGEKARDELQSARLVKVENLNHTPYYEDPALFNDTLLRFLSGNLDSISHPGLTLR